MAPDVMAQHGIAQDGKAPDSKAPDSKPLADKPPDAKVRHAAKPKQAPRQGHGSGSRDLAASDSPFAVLGALKAQLIARKR